VLNAGRANAKKLHTTKKPTCCWCWSWWCWFCARRKKGKPVVAANIARNMEEIAKYFTLRPLVQEIFRASQLWKQVNVRFFEQMSLPSFSSLFSYVFSLVGRRSGRNGGLQAGFGCVPFSFFSSDIPLFEE
jgi:hypothetical protein